MTLHGGNGGEPFDDGTGGSVRPRLSAIIVRYGWRLDFIQCQYDDGTFTQGHGGEGGQEQVFQLLPDEHIVSISGRSADEVDGIQFTTNTGRQSPYFGGSGGNAFVDPAPQGMRLYSFRGRSAARVDALAPNWV
ncbi:jacalin-like lectin domain protein [Mycena albidolilacea]|uniref:Jacalin-like lectin domain protein n=1 Tax=Mycena albidolilacea TaxID=1033008 RepID=A0AAD7AJT0_9AGAR|nr:jacalin-like lectin domain protein [Mycena albidolilacea]